MFSLIITIISIVLVGLLAVATIYYGGDAFSNRGDEARADRLLNEGQQLAGAAVLAQNDGVVIADLDDLNPDYVTGDFAGWELNGDTFQTKTVGGTQPVTAEICAKVVEKTGTNDKISCAALAADSGTFVTGDIVLSYSK